MTGFQDFIAAVESTTSKPGRRTGRHVKLLCPAHDDHEPSLEVAEGDDGSPLVQCRSRGCTYEDICAAIGHRPADFLPARTDRAQVATYPYVDAEGKLLYEVVRYEPKTFRQRRPDGTGGWIWRLGDTPRVLYRLPQVLAAAQHGQTIYVVEGEKDVHAIERAGAIATTNAGGAGKWRSEYATTLANTPVVIVADRDQPGIDHARQVLASIAAQANGQPCRACVTVPVEGKDAADHLAAGYELAELQPLDDDEIGPLLQPTTETEQPYTITIYTAPELAALELPESAAPIVGPFLRQGMVTLIGGLTGHGKTTWIAHLLRAAVKGDTFLGEQGVGDVRVLILDLEQHLASIQREIREAGLDDCPSIDYAPIPEGLALDKRIDQLAALEQVFDDGPYDVIAIDPFYKLHEADSSDELQARLLVALLRRWIHEHGFALLTATHCRKLPPGRLTITLDDLFGSSLFTRDPETILGIQRTGSLTKLMVFKSREPGLDYGQTFEMLFTRERGYWLKPEKDPAELQAELEADGERVRQLIHDQPGMSTNALKTRLEWGRKRLDRALSYEAKSGLVSGPIKQGRGAMCWFPPNHAGFTLLDTAPDQVGHDDSQGINETTLLDLSEPLIKGQGESKVDEASPDADDDIPF